MRSVIKIAPLTLIFDSGDISSTNLSIPPDFQNTIPIILIISLSNKSDMVDTFHDFSSYPPKRLGKAD